MAEYKVIDAEQLDSDLTIVADAIRSKGGIIEQLSFPQGMKEAVEAIQSGGGSGEEFVGVKYSDFSQTYNLPQVADMRSMIIPSNAPNNYFYGFFQNNNQYVEQGYHTLLRDVYLPDSIKAIANRMFCQCRKLKNIYGLESCKLLLSEAFLYCVELEEFPYMPNLDLIEVNAFGSCTNLKTVKLYKKPATAISLHDFANNCPNITDIFVPWSEGEVNNPPWGAVNATIHYNTVYDENHEPIV